MVGSATTLVAQKYLDFQNGSLLKRQAGLLYLLLCTALNFLF